MKRLFISLTILGFALSMFSCAEIQKLDVVSIQKYVPTGTITGETNFKKGEVLCAYYEDRSLLDNRYSAAKVMTPASSQTKNQAEVIFVTDGKKKWAKYVIPSHKADKSELKIGKLVLRHQSAYKEEISAEVYRKSFWAIKRISSIDELFKGVVEVAGMKSHIKWLRIPDQPLE